VALRDDLDLRLGERDGETARVVGVAVVGVEALLSLSTTTNWSTTTRLSRRFSFLSPKLTHTYIVVEYPTHARHRRRIIHRVVDKERTRRFSLSFSLSNFEFRQPSVER
jgi:hypothetical protein